MNLRKLTSITLVTAMTAGLALTGCGGSDGKDSGSGSGSGDKDAVTIKWISQGTGEDGWEGLTKPILEAYEEETGVHIEAEFYSFNDLFEVIETKSAAGDSDFDVMSVDVTFIS